MTLIITLAHIDLTHIGWGLDDLQDNRPASTIVAILPAPFEAVQANAHRVSNPAAKLVQAPIPDLDGIAS